MTSASTASSKEMAVGQISISFELLAYIAVISLSLVFRVIALGDTPLGQAESREALAALRALSSSQPASGSVDSILIFGGAVVSFALATPSNAAARLLPNIVGGLLTLSPLLFRRQLGRASTLVAIALLSVSPTAVVISREMTGTGIAILSILVLIWLVEAFLATRRPALISTAGVAFALAILADFAALLIAAALVLAVVFARLTDEEGELTSRVFREIWEAVPIRQFLVVFAASLAAFSTLFFLSPFGLGTLGNHLSRFLAGTVTRESGTPYLGIVLVAYEPLLIVFGMIGAWIASQSPRPWHRILAGWGVASILISLLYQGLLPAHGLWVVVPLAALAAVAAKHMTTIEHDAPSWAIFVYVAAVAGCLAMIYFRAAHHLRAPSFQPIGGALAPDQAGINVPIDLVWIAISLILIALLWLAVASFWEPSAAWQGLGLGLIIPGIVLMVGQSGELIFAKPLSPYELFHTSSPQQGLVHLVNTAEEISKIATGNPTDAEITIQGDSNGILAWSFSSFKNVRFVDAPNSDIRSVMVITPADGSSPFLGSSYVGQDFVIISTWDSAQIEPSEALGWLLFRTATLPPLANDKVILWVQEDIYRLVPQRASP